MSKMIRIEIDRDSFEKGEEDGREGRKYSVPPGVDSFSYSSGFVEGKAVRSVIREIEKERGGR